MPYSVYFEKRLDKSFEKIDGKFKEKILDAISELEHFSSTARNIKKLHTPFDGYRKRVGDYRVLFKVSNQKIFVYAIKHRKDVYK